MEFWKESYLQKDNNSRCAMNESLAKNENTKKYLLLAKMFQHEQDILHQYKCIKSVKESFTETDAIIHMDFSENYTTKFNLEVQLESILQLHRYICDKIFMTITSFIIPFHGFFVVFHEYRL